MASILLEFKDATEEGNDVIINYSSDPHHSEVTLPLTAAQKVSLKVVEFLANNYNFNIDGERFTPTTSTPQ